MNTEKKDFTDVDRLVHLTQSATLCKAPRDITKKEVSVFIEMFIVWGKQFQALVKI